MSASNQQPPIEVEVMTIRRRANAAPATAPHVVVLEERGGTRRLPLFVDAGACKALAQTLTKPELPPPPTYALATALVTAAGGNIREVEFTQLAGDVVYATVLLDCAGKVQRVDARPSDALNIALLARVPMRVHPTIFVAVDTALTERGRRSQHEPEGADQAEGLALLDGSWRQWSRTDA